MTDTDLDVDLGALRRRVRAAQHTRSVPLIILGVLLVNYGAVWFAPSPVPWRFGAPLAFVAVWVVLRIVETRTGVGATRGADYLVAGGFVFTVTNIVQVRPFTQLIDINRLPGVWTIVVALALLAVAMLGTDWLLMLASAAIGVAGGFLLVAGSIPSPSIAFLGVDSEQPWGFVLVAAVGALLALAGILAYRVERAAS